MQIRDDSGDDAKAAQAHQHKHVYGPHSSGSSNPMQPGTMNSAMYEQLNEEQKVAELHKRDKEIHELRNRLASALAEICLAARPATGTDAEDAAQLAAPEDGK